MRILVPVLLATCLLGCGSEMLLDEPKAISNVPAESSESKILDATAKSTNILDGALDLFELKQQYQQLEENGIDTSKEYKWEFRFQGRIMSSLEDFAQMAHLYGFWPVALESTTDGGMYWLYIQKTDTYTEEKFVEEISGLFEMAKRHSLSRFDGFSIDHAATPNDDPNNGKAASAAQ
ncbi:ribonuclease E inhibitor RraB [Alteromonas sp. S015]|uniref:ribonuclease E inhibitor RraB n=1 Tax=Alteromonas sp. S015 TaxID=3117401 RepID=UPI002FE13838